MPAGRPPRFATVEQLQPLIDTYFVDGRKITVTGLALHLGFTSRQALLNYQGKEEFVDAIKEAKLRIEQYYEENLLSKNLGGAVFALKNFGWSDKQEHEHSGAIDVKYTGIEVITEEVPPPGNTETRGLS